jgi:hypothetical protein
LLLRAWCKLSCKVAEGGAWCVSGCGGGGGGGKVSLVFCFVVSVATFVSFWVEGATRAGSGVPRSRNLMMQVVLLVTLPCSRVCFCF